MQKKVWEHIQGLVQAHIRVWEHRQAHIRVHMQVWEHIQVTYKGTYKHSYKFWSKNKRAYERL